jgi:hypothetical protein
MMIYSTRIPEVAVEYLMTGAGEAAFGYVVGTASDFACPWLHLHPFPQQRRLPASSIRGPRGCLIVMCTLIQLLHRNHWSDPDSDFADGRIYRPDAPGTDCWDFQPKLPTTLRRSPVHI